ncbi:MAG TPA: histidine kinase [Casimicrobiaceae bacterium]
MSTTKSVMSFEGSRLLEGAGREVMTDMNRFFSKDRLERAAMQDERLRLARDLHDGVLQSLAGAVLQLEAVSRVMETDPAGARKRLRAIEELIVEEQGKLRVWVESLQPNVGALRASGAELTAAMAKLRGRVEWQWGLQVELVVNGRGTVPRALGDEIYRLVQEALTNVGRHAHARTARVGITLSGGSSPVHITVTDDGCGFPVRGRFNLAELTARRVGPRSLRERVASLGGELVLTSSLSGSRLEISLPLDQRRERQARSLAGA